SKIAYSLSVRPARFDGRAFARTAIRDAGLHAIEDRLPIVGATGTGSWVLDQPGSVLEDDLLVHGHERREDEDVDVMPRQAFLDVGLLEGGVLGAERKVNAAHALESA